MTVFECVLDLVSQGYSVTFEQPYSDAPILSVELYKDGAKSKGLVDISAASCALIPKDEPIVRTLNRALYEHQYFIKKQKEKMYED